MMLYIRYSTLRRNIYRIVLFFILPLKKILDRLEPLVSRIDNSILSMLIQRFLERSAYMDGYLHATSRLDYSELERSLAKERSRFRQAKDSWARHLRLDEIKRINKVTIWIIATGVLFIFLGLLVGLYYEVSSEFVRTKEFVVPVAVGTLAAIFFWLLVSYGDHGLRKVRVRRGWYGSNAMEVYELVRFIRKVSEENDSDNDDSNTSRRFFEDDELAKKTNDVLLPNGLRAR